MGIITLESELIETAVPSLFATQILRSLGILEQNIDLSYSGLIFVKCIHLCMSVYVKLVFSDFCHVTCLFLQLMALY